MIIKNNKILLQLRDIKKILSFLVHEVFLGGAINSYESYLKVIKRYLFEKLNVKF